MNKSITSHLLRAAEGGDAGSQFNLGVLYDNRLDDNGHAISGNRAEAIKWLSLAAEQNLPHAQIKLAEVYADRPDVPENSVKACAWFLRGAANSSGMHRQRAQTGFARVAAHLTPAQIGTARHLALAPKRTAPGDGDIPAGVLQDGRPMMFVSADRPVPPVAAGMKVLATTPVKNRAQP
jgi:TPR repeat protein